MRWTIRTVAVGLVLLASASASLPAEEQTPEPAAGWQFDAMPYAWLAGSFGSVQVRGRTADIDSAVGNGLTLLWHGDALTLGGYFAARYDRWSACMRCHGRGVPRDGFGDGHVVALGADRGAARPATLSAAHRGQAGTLVLLTPEERAALPASSSRASTSVSWPDGRSLG